MINIPDRDTQFKTWKRHGSHMTSDVLGWDDEKPAAAGVLPFCVVEGKVFLLLGRESYRNGFSANHTWCDFGGVTSNVQEKTSVHIAAQELQEESFGSIIEGPLTTVIEYIVHNTLVRVSSDLGSKTPYHMYVVQIPYCDIPNIFMARHRVAKQYQNCDNTCMDKSRLMLKSTQPCGFRINGKVRKTWLEKDDMKWVSLQHVKDMHLNFRKEFYQTLVRYHIIDQLHEFGRVSTLPKGCPVVCSPEPDIF